MSDLVLTPEEMVAELQYRSEIIKELVETNGGLRDENEKLRAKAEVISDYHEGFEEGLSAMKAENERIKAAFRVNMLRCFPNMSHEEIDAEIESAIRENEYWNMESITQNIRENE